MLFCVLGIKNNARGFGPGVGGVCFGCFCGWFVLCACGFFECFCFVCFFPGEAGVCCDGVCACVSVVDVSWFSSEVAVACGWAEDWFSESECFDDSAWCECEDLADCVSDFALFDFFGALALDPDACWFCDADGVAELEFADVCESCCDDVFSDVSCHVCC